MSIEKFREAHTSPDTDQSVKAIHHTLGTGPNQAAPGPVMNRVRDLEYVVVDLIARIEALENGP